MNQPKNTIGGADSNKLVGTPAEIGNIVTGTATSAGSPDVSNWAMKLAIIQDSGDIETAFYPSTTWLSKTHGQVVRCLQDYTGR